MIHNGDALSVLQTLPNESVQCCVTSPPYWGLRDYGVDGQLGLEKTPEEYVAKMVEIFREVRRVLRSDGTCWINLGDSYSGGGRGGDPKHSKGDNSAAATMESYKGIPPKNLVMIPARVALALQADGWWLRSVIIWAKPNPMPESVTDRPTTAHEYIYLLAKSEKYYYNADAIAEDATLSSLERWSQPNIDNQIGSFRANGGAKTNGTMKAVGGPRRHKNLAADGQQPNSMHINRANGDGEPITNCKRNKRTVWTVATQPYPEAHFATYPEKLIEPCILAGCPEGGVVLDPFLGSGTTAAVALRLRREFVGA